MVQKLYVLSLLYFPGWNRTLNPVIGCQHALFMKSFACANNLHVILYISYLRKLIFQALKAKTDCRHEQIHSKEKYFRAPFLVLQVVTNRGLYSVPDSVPEGTK